MRRRGLYVYALLGTSIAGARLPLRRIEIVPVGGLFAAAERFLSPPALTEAALRRQHRIVVKLSRLSTAVLPVRFGAFMTDDELPQIVRARRTVLLRALKQVRGRDQMTLRIFGPPLEVLPASRSSSGSDYLRARAAAIRPTLTPGARALVKAVSSVVDDQHVSGSRGGVQLTIDHLVRRSNVARYRRLLSSCAGELQPRLDIAVSGPWPPFAFAPDIWTSAAEGRDS